LGERHRLLGMYVYSMFRLVSFAVGSSPSIFRYILTIFLCNSIYYNHTMVKQINVGKDTKIFLYSKEYGGKVYFKVGK